jgi:hypothetical protein
MKDLLCIKCKLVIPSGVTCRIRQFNQSKTGEVSIEQVEHLHNCLTLEGAAKALAMIEQDKKFKEGLNANRNGSTEDTSGKEEGSGSSLQSD